MTNLKFKIFINNKCIAIKHLGFISRIIRSEYTVEHEKYIRKATIALLTGESL